jgi:hypothetical protein
VAIVIDWRKIAKINHPDSALKPASQYPQNSQIEISHEQNANIENIAMAYSRLNQNENRLRELILMADNSKGMSSEQIRAISEEGSLIIRRLTPETVERIFREC